MSADSAKTAHRRLISRTARSEPALDVRTQPAPSSAGTLRWKCAGAHPTVVRAAVPARDLLDIPRAEHLVDTGDSYGQRTRHTLAADRHGPARAGYVRTFERWLRRHYASLFEMELNSWYTDPSLWPSERWYALCGQWFRARALHSSGRCRSERHL